MKTNKIKWMFIACIFFVGCAGTKIESEIGGKKYSGYTLYQPKAYLWVTSDSSGGKLQYKLIYLPNKSEPVTITPKRGMGSGKTNFKVTDGWLLSEFGAESDSKVPETITAGGSLLTGFASAVTSVAGLAGLKSKMDSLQSLKDTIEMKRDSLNSTPDKAAISTLQKSYDKEINRLNELLKKLEKENPIGLYELMFDSSGRVSGFVKVKDYPLPIASVEKPVSNCPDKGCQCDYKGKKYSEGSVMVIEGSTKEVKINTICTKGLWVIKN